MIYDIFTFNGEYDLLEIRLNILSDYVDKFIIVESPTTFSGKQKPLYYLLHEKRFKKWKKKIKYFVNIEDYSKEELEIAYNSPNTTGAEHWKHEFLQKESIKRAITHLKDDDICFIGDIDEIWNPDIALNWCDAPFKYELKVYSYYLNNRSSEKFYGTLVSPYHAIKNSCLNHLRTNAWKTAFQAGWHFTSMGGYTEVRRKLEDSYTEETYAAPNVINGLFNNMAENKDFLGRDFKYEVDESEWPEYLAENKDKYLHLCK